MKQWKCLQLTLTSLFLGGLPAAVAQPWDGLDVALADWWRMKHKLGRAGQAHRKSCRAHQDPCDSYQQPSEGVLPPALPSGFTSIQRQMKSELPASAGCTGLDPFRFFTGTVGTLQGQPTWVWNRVTGALKQPRASLNQIHHVRICWSPVSTVCSTHASRLRSFCGITHTKGRQVFAIGDNWCFKSRIPSWLFDRFVNLFQGWHLSWNNVIQHTALVWWQI